MAAKAKVLLVASTPFCLEQMKSFLKSSPVALVTAETAAAALEIARSQHPGIIFMEMDLPGQSGVECCWQLRQDAKFAKTHIVLLTPGDRDEDRRACYAARCTEVLPKPLDRRRFLAVGRQLLASIDRREPRLPCRATVACRNHATFYGTIEDVSAHGMFIGTPQPGKLGEMLQLKFLLPWHEATLIECTARITWLNAGRKAKLPPGYGVEFIDPSPAISEQLADFLEHSHLRLHPPADW